MISFNLLIIKSFSIFFGNTPLIFLNSSFLSVVVKDFKVPTGYSVCFSKAFPKGEYANLAWFVICF